jgi:hypothetical protein
MVSPGFPLVDAGLTDSVNGLGTTGPEESGRPVAVGCVVITVGEVGFCPVFTALPGVGVWISVVAGESTTFPVLTGVIISCERVATVCTGVASGAEVDLPGPDGPGFDITAKIIRPVIRIPAKTSTIRIFLFLGSIVSGINRSPMDIFNGYFYIINGRMTKNSYWPFFKKKGSD